MQVVLLFATFAILQVARTTSQLYTTNRHTTQLRRHCKGFPLFGTKHFRAFQSNLRVRVVTLSTLFILFFYPFFPVLKLNILLQYFSDIYWKVRKFFCSDLSINL